MSEKTKEVKKIRDTMYTLHGETIYTLSEKRAPNTYPWGTIATNGTPFLKGHSFFLNNHVCQKRVPSGTGALFIILWWLADRLINEHRLCRQVGTPIWFSPTLPLKHFNILRVPDLLTHIQGTYIVFQCRLCRPQCRLCRLRFG